MDILNNIYDKIFYIIVNIGIVAFLNYFFNKKLQRQTTQFSLYNGIQIEALKKIYKLLTAFKFLTIQILEHKEKEFSYYNQISNSWLNSFTELTTSLSNEKYILPKNLKNSYANTIDELNILRNFLINNTKLKDNFETHFDGLEYKQIIKPFSDENYINELYEKIKLVESDKLFNTVIKKVEILRNNIEIEFEKMN